MDIGNALPRLNQVDDFLQAHQTSLVTMLFTDVVGSTKLKETLGDRQSVALLQTHRSLVREIRARFPDSEEIETAGDSFLILFAKPSNAASFALLLQARLRKLREDSAFPVQIRIGIHVGEVIVEQHDGTAKPKDLYGSQVDACARVTSLADADQILMTRGAFDNARQMLRGQDVPGLAQISWMNYGPYVLKGIEDPVEICEVGETGRAKLTPPEDTEKVRRFISPESEPVLGWRPAIGQTVPNTKWDLREKLGEGGFGEVWLAHHQMLKDTRVFKFCFRADRVRSLRRELTLFRLLKERMGQHPNIVGVQEVFFDYPPFYLVMDHAEGRELRGWVEALGGFANLSLDDRLEIVAQSADALQAAHDSGIIHRDVKPSNLIVTRVPAPGQPNGRLLVKLTDFGIGQVMAQEYLEGITRAGFTGTALTHTGSQSGTQLYQAPEIHAGKPASAESDTYALGVVLYQLLVGDFTHPVATDWAQHIADPLLREDLQKCFAGDPAERFARTAQLAENLRSLPARRVEHAAQLARHSASVRAAYRRGVYRTAALATAVLVIIASLLVVAVRQTRLAETREQTAQQERQRADEQRDAAKRAEADAEKQRDRAQAATADANQQLHRLRVRNAHTAFDSGRPAEGLAWLATVLRQDPQSRFAGSWIVSALSEYNFPLPAAPPMTVKVPTQAASRMNAVRFSPDGARVVMGGANRFAQVFDVATAQPLSPPLPHDAEVNDVCFSLDGRRVISASKDQTVRVWDAATGNPVGEPLRHAAGVLRVQFSPDGSELVSADVDGQVKIWEGRSFALITEAIRHTKKINDLDFSPDGRLLATASEGDGAQLWEMPSGKVPKGTPLGARLNTHSNVYAIRFSRAGDLVFTGASGNQAGDRVNRWQSWHLDGKPAGTSPVEGGPPTAIRLAPFGNRMTVVAGTQFIRIWDTRGGPPLLAPLRAGSSARSAEFSPEGLRLFTTSGEGSLRLWDVRSGLPQAEPFRMPGITALDGLFSPGGDYVAFRRGFAGFGKGGGAQVFDVRPGRALPLLYKQTQIASQNQRIAVSPEGKRLLVWAIGPPVKILDFQTGKQLGDTMTNGTGTSWVEFSADGSKVATASYNGTARVWDAWTGKPIGAVLRHEGSIDLATFSPDGRQVATAGRIDKTVRVWDAQTGRSLAAPIKHPGAVGFVRFSPDAKLLASGGQGIMMHEWSTGRLLYTFRQDDLASVQSGEFSPDGSQLGFASSDRRGHLLDARTGKELPSALAHDSPVRWTRFSPDGRRILTTSADGMIKVWDASTGKLTGAMAHSDGGVHMQFSPDGERVATSSYDGTARVWDAATGQPLSAALKHEGFVEDVCFTPDGQSVVTTSRDGLIRVWSVPALPAPGPSWLADLAEAVAAERVDAGGMMDSEKPPDYWTVRAKVLEQTGNDTADPYLKWAKWFFADRSTRTISAFSSVTVPEHIQNLFPLSHHLALEEVLRLSPTNTAATTWIAKSLRRATPPPPNAEADAEYLEAIVAGLKQRAAATSPPAGKP